MDDILKGFYKALQLIFLFDSDLYEIAFLSVKMACLSSIAVFFLAVPVGTLLGLKKRKYERLISQIIFSLMGIPSVVIGLLVALFLSRTAPLGFLRLLNTPTAIVIAEILLVFPLGIGLSYKLSQKRGRKLWEMAFVLGASPFQSLILIFSELKEEIGVIFLTCFARAITEVGAVMIVGGNIANRTRTLTTAISMFNSLGNYSTGIALGLILLMITFFISFITFSINNGDLDD